VREALAILPARDEGASVGATVRELRVNLPQLDVLVVDDGSTDDTAAAAERAGATVLRHPTGQGVARAEATALRYAEERNYRHVVRLDADGQHDPASVPAVLAALEHADLVVGSRFLGEDASASTVPRRLGSRLLAAMLWVSTGQKLTDPTSGFRGFGPRGVALLHRAELTGYPEPESILLALRSGLRVAEVPVRMRPRGAGKSSLTPLTSTRFMVKATVAIARELLRRRA
jgi:glycosyltransferase involved in cell wall biosynthesis